MVRLALCSLLFGAAVSAEPIMINYSARVIDVSGNSALVNDFLNVLGLHTVAGPTGTEIPFSGSYTFDYPQSDQAPSTDRVGLYLLRSFTINGISLAFGTGDPLLNRIDLEICGPCALRTDFYIVGAFNAIIPASNGTTRSLQVGLELDLPGGTLTDALPANIDFFGSATGFTYGSSPVLYSGTSLGATVWESASVASVPEPLMLPLLGLVFACLLPVMCNRA